MEQPWAADPGRYDAGAAKFKAALAVARVQNLRPPPRLTLSQWAERYAYLSPETSAETGRFRAFPYQNGIMDAVTDPSIDLITVKKSARVGYTKILDHIVGYYIHQDPSPILVVQPREEDAEDYSSTEIEPMLRDTPVLAEIAGDPKAKSSKQKIRKRLFRNGASIAFVGANAPGGFRRITSRIILLDEVDGYPVRGAGKEGDQVKLAFKRAESFWNRKRIIGSTPTEEGESRIDKSWLLSDQRRFFIPCPTCSEFQYLEWGGKDLPYGIKWDKDADGKAMPETAHYVCKAHGCTIDETDKESMEIAGEWRATAPFKGHAGFHIWAGYSLFPNASWRNLVAEWDEVKDDPLGRQTFVNLVLGEAYADRGLNALDEKRLLTRCELFTAEVPDGVALITVGVDVQGDRLELEVVGWGRNEESWSIAYEVIDDDPAGLEAWARLDEYLKRKWYRADGRAFVAEAVCIDTGGNHTQSVYDFCKARIGRKIWGIKGESAQGGPRNPVWPTKTPTRRTKKSYRPVILGVNAAKDTVRASLRVEQRGPRYMHFPADRDLGYFQQLISERAVLHLINGQRFWKWELPGGRTNEALDCRVYAYAALCGLIHRGLKLNRRADQVGAEVTPEPKTPIEKPPLEAAARAPVFDPPMPVDDMPPPRPLQPASAAPDPKRMKSAAERLAARLSRMK